jgi:endonuclease/exonuclease/phosphatase family metal-dependent hydrolase
MFFRANTFSDKLTRLLSLDEWMVKLLGLSVMNAHSAHPGAVIIQVDGLSQVEFMHAVHQREMPFLARLLKKEGYTEYTHYSGLPSSTPAVQGSFFYGVKSCVPAFSYQDKKSGEVFNMLLPENAAEIEKRIKKMGAPLLKDGSAYGNIFTGGAAEAHFCVSAIGWGALLKAAHPIAIMLFSLMHLHIIIRSLLLSMAEFCLALFDSLRGFIAGGNLLQEIKYIPFRVVACVILREIIGVGAKIDITRGIPIIHMNLVGYDEQSHHRGPRSKFAHWSLRAIDSVIRIVWNAAKRSTRRDYDVIIYSDHGQEEAITYRGKHGRPVQAAINEVLQAERLRGEFKSNDGYKHADMLRNRLRPPHRPPHRETGNDPAPDAVITAQGPLGHVYLPIKLSWKAKTRIAHALVKVAKIPLALVAAPRGRAIAWNAEGRFLLPREAAAVLGADHPCLKETALDLVKACRHKDAGEIIISGFSKQGKSVTFYDERGSHGGPGPHETAGFALLPPDLTRSRHKIIHTAEIRAAVFRLLKYGNDGKFEISKMEAPPDGPLSLRIMSYNVHGCKGRDGKVRPERIARVIARHNPDIVALQEMDADDTQHQAKEIADRLSLNYHYHSSVLLKTGQHGNAIFSKFNVKLIKRGALPSFMQTPLLEKRGVLWVEVNAHGRKVQVINTHLSLFPPEGLLQAKSLLGGDWLGHPACQDPVVLCGDFNSRLNSMIGRTLGKEFHSILFDVPGARRLKTFPSFFPLGLVDHIFLGPGVKAVKIETPKTHLEKTASDHLPLIVEIRIEKPGKRAKSVS